MRKAHLLKNNKGSEFPQEIVFVDTETLSNKLNEKQVEHKFRLGVALYWRTRNGGSKDTLEWFRFNKPKQFWKWLFKKSLDKRRLVIMAHNIAYDMRILDGFNVIKKNKYKLKTLISEHFVNIWKFKKRTRTLLFLDSMNFFGVSLERLGKDIGLEKMKMPDYEIADEEWFDYCQRDVEILYNAVKLWSSFIAENGLGCFSMTLASQAFRAFRHKFNSYKIYIHNNEKAIELERESYHGGRTECFYIGKLPKKEYYYLDINSMYPAVMSKNSYPIRLRAYLKKVSIPNLKKFLKLYCVTARVRLKIDEPVFSYKYNKKLCFPIGEFTTVLTSRELSYAVEKSYIKKCYEATIYDKAPIFIKYIDFFYKKRLEFKREGNFSFSYISKLLLNSLYGKWGQRNKTFDIVAEGTDLPNGYFEEWDLDTGEKIEFRVINGTLEKAEKKVEAFNSFPAIASHITADARLGLWAYIKIAGRSNVFYCDTDSLFVSSIGYNNLKPYLSQNIIGKMKLEYQSNNVEIRGLKDYTFGNKTKIKGISKSAVKISDNEYEQWQWEGFKGSLRENRLSRVILSKVIKTLLRDYNKGIVKKSNFVEPFNLNEL